MQKQLLTNQSGISLKLPMAEARGITPSTINILSNCTRFLTH